MPKKRKKTNCLGGGDLCEVKDQTTSRWEDMKISCFLLGNAFRVDSGKPPEKVKQVVLMKVVFEEFRPHVRRQWDSHRQAFTR